MFCLICCVVLLCVLIDLTESFSTLTKKKIMTTQHLHLLEKTVESAGTQLDTVATKLNEVENIISAGGDEVDDVSVIQLLECMTDVQNEYQNLRKDLKEVQELQKEMTTTLIYQRTAMLHTFNVLKKRIEKNLEQRRAELNNQSQ